MCGLFFIIFLFVACPTRGQFFPSELDGILERTPEVVEHGMEVRVCCKFYKNEEDQYINIFLSVTPGENSTNAGNEIETYKAVDKRYIEDERRRVAARCISFTARIEDNPVKVECSSRATFSGSSYRSPDMQGMPGLAEITTTLLPVFIDMLDDPEIVEMKDCGDKPPEKCVLNCKILHKKSIMLMRNTCQWRYRPSSDAPSIVVPSSDYACTRKDGSKEELSLDLSDRGAFAGEYICHADYEFLISGSPKKYEVNGILKVDGSNTGSNLDGPCTSQWHCKTYRATCVKKDGETEGTCQCTGNYPEKYIRTVDDEDYVLSCYGGGKQPVDSTTNELWNGPLMMILTITAITVMALYKYFFGN